MNIFVLAFVGGIAQWSRDMLQMGDIAQMCLAESKCQGWGIAPFWGAASLPEKNRAIWGIATIVVAIIVIWGPLSSSSSGIRRGPTMNKMEL